jgi:hypothetical protein
VSGNAGDRNADELALQPAMKRPAFTALTEQYGVRVSVRGSVVELGVLLLIVCGAAVLMDVLVLALGSILGSP